MNNMIVSIANAYRWPPKVLNGLYVDDIDILGLEFWYNQAKEQIEEK